MRIRKLKVQNFRIHRDCVINFDERLTLISGPNESGKSTLMQALHCAFFLKAKGNSKEHKAIKSRLHAGDPTVELEFELGTRQFELTKTYRGASGAALLRERGGQSWRDAAAEEQLAELLQHVGTSGWNSLFVRQGTSGNDPVEVIAKSEELLGRLRQMGGAVVTATAHDEELSAAVGDFVNSTYTQTGTPRRNSDLEQATSRAAELKADYDRAARRQAALQESAETVLLAEGQIAEKDEILQELQSDLEQVESQLVRAGELQAVQARLEAERSLRQGRLKEVKAADQQIVRLEQTLQNEAAALEPLRRELDELKSRIHIAAEGLVEANQLAESAETELEQRRLECELASATRERLEQETRLVDLNQQLAAIQELRDEVATLGDRQNSLLPITEQQVQELAGAESRVREQQAAVRAMGARIRVLAAEAPVSIGGEVYETGAEVVLTNDTELTYAGGLRLIVSPGGEEGLQQAVAHLKQAEEAFRNLLAARGVVSVAEAATFARDREALSLQLKGAQKRLKEMKPSELEAARTEVAIALSQARSRCEQLGSSGGGTGLQAGATSGGELNPLESARIWLGNVTRQREQAEAIYREREGSRKRQQERINQLTGERTEKEATIATRTQAAALQAGELQSSLRTWGDEVTRKSLRDSLEGELAGLSEQLKKVEVELKPLAPDELQSRRERLTTSRQRHLTGRQEAHDRLIAARTLLQREESEDPIGECELARVRWEQAQEHLAGIELKAKAYLYLHELYQQEKQRAAEQYTENLRSRIAEYLQRMYGPGASVRVTTAADGLAFESISVSRPELGNEEFEFGTLSGGTSEQVAAATRLAVAEILASEYEGCLPVIFDDSFTNSDPDRVLKLQDMLYLAADRGLQVIVLSCAPRDFRGLGARDVALTPLRREGVQGEGVGVDSCWMLVERAPRNGAAARCWQLPTNNCQLTTPRMRGLLGPDRPGSPARMLAPRFALFDLPSPSRIANRVRAEPRAWLSGYFS